MEGTFSFPDFRSINVDRCQSAWGMRLSDWSSEDWMVAVGGELGEALNVIKKLNRDDRGWVGNTKTRAELLADLADELADAAIYLDLLLASEGFEAMAEYDILLSAGFGETSPLSSFGADAIKAAGELTRCLHECDTDTAEDIAHAGEMLLAALAAIANRAGIDLVLAIISKFNRTSEKLGFPHRLQVMA